MGSAEGNSFRVSFTQVGGSLGSDNAKSFDNIALRSLCFWKRAEPSTWAPKKYSISPVSLRRGAATSIKLRNGVSEVTRVRE